MFQRIRTVLFWAHLVLGVTTAAVALMLCVTGTLLAFELPVTRWADRQLVTAPADAVSPASVEAVASAVVDFEGRTPRSITVERHVQGPAVASFGRRDRVMVDPWTHVSLRQGAEGVHTFFRGLMTFHRWFSLEGARRVVGRQVVGVCTLAFVLLTLTGIVLWLPSRWRWKNVRQVLWFRRRLRGKARDFNWHNVLGFWSLIPLFVLALTGAAIGYDWLSDGIVRAVGASSPDGEPPRGGGPPSDEAPPELPVSDRLAGADAAVSAVLAEHGAWERVSVEIPDTAADAFSVTVDSGNGRQPQLRTEYTVERGTNEILERSGWAETAAERKVRIFIRFGHTGELGGVAGIALAAVASAAGAVLAVTGVTLSLRRWFAWRRRRRRSGGASDVE